VRAVLAETRRILDAFERQLDEFSAVLDELEAETKLQRERPKRRGWL
jgi:hypothetical protein